MVVNLGVLIRRLRGDMSFAEYGELVGVTGHSVRKWEYDEAVPRWPFIDAMATHHEMTDDEVNALLRLCLAAGIRQENRRKRQTRQDPTLTSGS